MEDDESLKIPGYEFWIEVDGKRAKQYQTRECDGPADGGNVVSCYIASEVGKEFRIGVRKHKESQSAVSVRFYLNNDRVAKRVIKLSRINDVFVSHTHTAKNQKQKFAFSTINFEEDELAEATLIPENLGSIRLEVFRITNIQKAVPKRRLYPTDMLNIPALSEKSKTVKLHTISLLKPEATEELHSGYYDFDYIDSSPWYTVKFLYRSLGVLQAEGIAPIPAPDVSEDEDEDEDEDENEDKDEDGDEDEDEDEDDDEGRTNQPSESDPARDQKPLIKTIKSENPSTLADGSKAEEPIVIMDSDEEDSKYLPSRALSAHMYTEYITQKFSSLKRTSASQSLDSGRIKRARKTSVDSVIIVWDSD